jgi:hypothetical protein
MRKLLIGTGWCAHKEGHNDPRRSERQNDPDYLKNFWLPAVKRQVNSFLFLYHSICNAVLVDEAKYFNNVIYSDEYAKLLPYRHDWAASNITAAAYAYANDMDYLFVEQDCLVVGLDKAVTLAREKGGIWYGYGDNASYRKGWAENCLIYVDNALLLAFIRAMHAIKDTQDGEPFLERRFHEELSKCEGHIHYWPFGCGRLRPIPWNEEVFYAQHLTDEELDKFKERLQL